MPKNFHSKVKTLISINGNPEKLLIYQHTNNNTIKAVFSELISS